jgi:hypothetical protein
MISYPPLSRELRRTVRKYVSSLEIILWPLDYKITKYVMNFPYSDTKLIVLRRSIANYITLAVFLQSES